MIVWEASAVISLALISGVVTLMLFRFVRPEYYLRCRPTLLVGGVVFMPLFIAIAVTLRADWTAAQRAVGVALLMIGFWASAAWLASPRTQGVWVPGLEFGPGLNFRPDLVLPGGVMFVKGIILTGIGIMLSVQDTFTLPKWNWWGFVLAFVGIIMLIPTRGVTKMLARRARFLGRIATWQGPARWGLLVGGLTFLLYGFLSAFMGRVPIIDIRPRSDLAWLAGVLVVVASVSLAFRERAKAKLLEGIETIRARIGMQVWLYGSVLVFMYGFIVAFMGRIMRPHPATNPTGLTIGAALFILGAVLVIGFRPFALRHELEGMIRVMVGTLGTMQPEQRMQMMDQRMRTIAACPITQRPWHVAEMISAIDTLDPDLATAVVTSRDQVMMSLESQDRMAMMEAMDQLVG